MNFEVIVKGYRAYVINGQGEAFEPVHVHIKHGKVPNDQAKFWISFDNQRVIMEHNRGKIPDDIWQEIIDSILCKEMKALLSFWADLKNVDIINLDYYDQHGYKETVQYYPSL